MANEITVRVYSDGVLVGTSTANRGSAFTVPAYGWKPGYHAVAVSAHDAAAGLSESPRVSLGTILVLDEEEGDAVPADSVNESTVSAVAGTTTRVDPSSPAAKRYKVTVVNEHAADRVYMSTTTPGAAGRGIAIEPDFGQADFYVTANVALYAYPAGINAIPLRVFECVTA